MQKLLEETKRNLMENYLMAEVPAENFDIPDIRILYCLVCLDPKSIFYGTMRGAFAYKTGDVYKFRYNIHRPESKGPLLSNQMTDIEKVVKKEVDGIPYLVGEETDFGRRAFWPKMPTEDLEGGELSLRLLIRSLQAYCRREEFCKTLRKLDREYEYWHSVWRMRSAPHPQEF